MGDRSTVRCALAAVVSASFALAWLASGCSEEEVSVPAKVTYHRDVRPLIEQRCATCHTADGPTPYDFTAPLPAEGAPEWAQAAVNAVSAGTMPPWMPAEGCRDLSGERRLSADERAVFEGWAAEGFALGEEADYVPPAPVDGSESAGPPTLELSPTEPYAPSSESVDDYRCFLLPHTFDAETYLTGSTVVPGQLALSHHALIYLIEPSSLATVEGLDAADSGPGYSCFGGPGGGALTTLGGWVPGGGPAHAADGSAMVIPAGSRLVLQMHYNTLAFGAGAEIPQDQSKVMLWTSAVKPSNRVVMLPFAHLGMEIEPFLADSVEERVYSMPTDGRIVGLTPHMHLLGKSIEVSFQSASSAEPACLVDVPAWDFHWQQQYVLAPGAAVDVKKGDKVNVRCTYDNSAANQPIVGGQQRMPETVRWGEGTLDEMCLAYLVVEVPFETPDFRCGAYPSCQPTCADGDGHCFFDCLTVGGGQCAACAMPKLFQCAPSFCASTGLALQSCVAGCEQAATTCLLHTCGAEWDAFYACMEPHIEGGDCNAQLESCNVAF